MNNNISAFSSVEYDENIIKTIPYYNEIYARIINFVKCNKNTALTWLDVGCGTGTMAKAADLKMLSFCRFHICRSG